MNLSQQKNYSLSETQADAIRATSVPAAKTPDQPGLIADLTPAQQDIVSLMPELRMTNGSERQFDFNVKPRVHESNRSAQADKEDLFDRMRRLFFEIPPSSNGLAHRSSATTPNDKL